MTTGPRDASQVGHRVIVGWRHTSRRRQRRIHIAKDDRQAVFATAYDDDFRIRGLRKLKRRLDATPTQVGLRNALANDLLKIAYAFCLDLLACLCPIKPLLRQLGDNAYRASPALISGEPRELR